MVLRQVLCLAERGNPVGRGIPVGRGDPVWRGLLGKVTLQGDTGAGVAQQWRVLRARRCRGAHRVLPSLSKSMKLLNHMFTGSIVIE